MTTQSRDEIASINGMEMHYQLYGWHNGDSGPGLEPGLEPGTEPGAEPGAEPLVLLHGFFGSSGDWGPMLEAFGGDYPLIVPDLRGHGRSSNPSREFTLRQSARDVFALLDRLGVRRFKAVGLSAGAKTLLHMATQQPDRVEAMVLVSGTTCFPPQARAIMAMVSPETQPESEWEVMRQRHRLGDGQIRELWRQANGFKDSYDDMNFTAPYLSTITARTLLVHGDRDPFYPNRIALDMREAIPRSWLWIVPNGGHGPIFGELNSSFLKTSLEFLRGAWEKTG